MPRADLRAGLAEVIKCGFIADPVILDLVEADPIGALDPAAPVLRELVERAVRVKANVVGADLRESGIREIVNYGHTMAHAIEKVEGYAWRHGDAVAVGLVYVAALARREGRLDPETAARHRLVLEAVGLPTSYRGGLWSELLAVMRIDKKARADRLRFVVLDGLARPTILEGPDEVLLREAYEEISA
jgi:3-dehydroquinate synthase